MGVILQILAVEIKGCPGYRLITLLYCSLPAFVSLSKFKSINCVLPVKYLVFPYITSSFE